MGLPKGFPYAFRISVFDSDIPVFFCGIPVKKGLTCRGESFCNALSYLLPCVIGIREYNYSRAGLCPGYKLPGFLPYSVSVGFYGQCVNTAFYSGSIVLPL